MSKRVHDADLCDRIKELEDRVRELEARPVHHCNGHWYWNPYGNAYPWTITSSGTSTSGTISYGNISVNNDDATNTARES